ncbi:MAG TPA: hypothetical protein VFH68_20325 [Polyangia bacterium]|nr:hypothetical protein [Polyangia bacterium]
MSSTLPISYEDVVVARSRIAPHLTPTPLRAYPQLSELVGFDIGVRVQHDNRPGRDRAAVRIEHRPGSAAAGD